MKKRMFIEFLAAISIASIIFSCNTSKNSAFTSDSKKVLLKWNIQDTVKYLTKMEPVEEDEFKVDFEGAFGKIFDSLVSSIDSTERFNDSTKTDVDKLLNYFYKSFNEQLKESKDSTETITYLAPSSNTRGVIDIEMVRKRLNENDSVKKSFFAFMPLGTILRGSIYENGALHSFWLNNGQRNLISMFFELPSKKVKKGDVWRLKYLNFIQYGNIFYCNKSVKKNEVKLMDLIKRNGETIAIIKYDIYEYVEGNIDVFGNLSPSKTEVKYNAVGEFSVDNGRWISYKGLLSISNEGFMNSNSKQKFELIAR